MGIQLTSVHCACLEKGVWECPEGGGGGPPYERQRDKLRPWHQDCCPPDTQGHQIILQRR